MPRIIGPALSLVQFLNVGIRLALLALVSRLAYIVLSPPILDYGPGAVTSNGNGPFWGIPSICAFLAYLRIGTTLGKKIPTSHRNYHGAAMAVSMWSAAFLSLLPGVVPLPGMVLYGFQSLADLWMHFFSVLTFKATLRANKDDQGAYGLLYHGTENKLVSVAPTSPQKPPAPGPVTEVGKVAVVSD